jgi:hypothetical protein
MPGLVSLVSRHGEVHVETLGTLAFVDPAPMKRDTIFRIASITKPITAVAAMILVEDCKLRLDDSIEPWLPELANRHVLKSISSDIDDTVPALRSIIVRDLLTYRMGFGSVLGFRNGGGHPVQRDLPHPRPVRLDRRLRHIGIHRSCRGNDRHPLHAAHDGFAGTAEGIYRFLDPGAWSKGIGKGNSVAACYGRRICAECHFRMSSGIGTKTLNALSPNETILLSQGHCQT